MSSKLITIHWPKELQVEGSEISGSILFNTVLAREKDVTAVKVSLKAQIKTWIRVNNGQSGSRTIIDSEGLFKIEQVLWSAVTVPLSAYQPGTVTLPFLITVPYVESSPLPASMSCGNSSRGGLIQYYIHAVAEKNAWYKRNTRVNLPFTLLPLDRTGASNLQLDNWTGPWKTLKKTTTARSNPLNIFGGSGTIEVSIQLPQLESLPLFTRIPCRITVICTSKSMSVAHSIDVTKFTFPRNPKPPDIQLDLRLHSRVKARGRHRSFVESYGLLGGFGRVVNPVGINALSTDPVWIPNQAKPNKGKWSESVTYNSSFLLQCPTPVNTRLIKTTIRIYARIYFPGLGNNWKATVGPLPLSSGIAYPQHVSHQANVNDISVPPSYWEVVGEDERNEKD